MQCASVGRSSYTVEDTRSLLVNVSMQVDRVKTSGPIGPVRSARPNRVTFTCRHPVWAILQKKPSSPITTTLGNSRPGRAHGRLCGGGGADDNVKDSRYHVALAYYATFNL